MMGTLLRLVMVCAWVLICSTGEAFAVERFAVLIGTNQGDSDEPNLRFAESDAERMYAVLKEVGGFRAENMLLLRGEPAPVVERALISMNDRLRAAAVGSNHQTMLFVYYSGHGDAQSLHLSRTKLELNLVEQLVRSSAAAFRILVVDACRSGALTRVKGGTVAPPFAVYTDEALNGEGVVFLTSNSASEDAQESDALAGSFFTHYLRSGLLGPADEDLDGRVTLDEAYRYAYGNTLRASSRTLSGTQHPTFRYELRGQGKVVLSEPVAYRSSRGTLTFPVNGSYLLLEHDTNGKVVGEVGLNDRNRRMSVTPGGFFIRGRRASYLLEGYVQVASGESLRVEDSRLERIEYDRLARKGGSDRRSAHGPQSGYSFRSALRNATTFCHGVFVGYSFAFPTISLTPRLEACRAGFSNEWVSAAVDAIDAGVRGAHVWDFRAVSFELGMDAGVALHLQRFESMRQTANRSTWGGYFGAGLGVAYDLGLGLSLFAESGAETHVYRLQDSESETESTAVSVAFRQRLGATKFW